MKTLTIEEYKKRIATLEAQREKFEASMNEFDRVKGDITLGIGAGNLTQEVLDKTGRELIGEEEVIQELLSVRGIDYQNMVNCKLKNYTLLEWTGCIKEGILIEYAVPMLSRLLAIHPLAAGIHYQGELLFYIVRAFQVGIVTQADWLQYFKELVTGIIKTETEETLKRQLIPGILKPILLFGGAVEMSDKVTLDLIGFCNQKFWRFFFRYYDGILEESGGYLEQPAYLEVFISRRELFKIEFHPGDTIFYMNGKAIGCIGSQWKGKVMPYCRLEKALKKNNGEILYLLLLPMAYIEAAEEEKALKTIENLLFRIFPQNICPDLARCLVSRLRVE